MAKTILCSEINQLTEFALIAGSREILEFYFYYEDGTPVDLSSSQVKWRLSKMGQQNIPILEKDGEIFEYEGVMCAATVVLSSPNTQNLSGKYLQQPILIDYQGQEYFPQQGIITFVPQISAWQTISSANSES